MSFVIAMGCFTFAGITVFRYISTSFSLLEQVQSSAPETWEKLGRPEKIWIKNGSGGGMQTIKPIWPWLNWVWHADTIGLDFEIGKELKTSKKFYLQQFKNDIPLISSNLIDIQPYSKEYFNETIDKVKSYFDICEMRGFW